jgi:hypothetical protein
MPFKLFGTIKWFIFYFSCFGGALQLTNMYGDIIYQILQIHQNMQTVLKYSTIIMSILKFLKPYLFWQFLFS